MVEAVIYFLRHQDKAESATQAVTYPFCNLSLVLNYEIKHHAMKTHGGVKV
jgi:hypothetical protein